MSTTEPQGSFRADIAAEQVKLGYRLSRIGLPSQVAAALIVWYATLGSSAHAASSTWVAVVIAINAVRGWDLIRFARDPKAAERHVYWMQRFATLALASGAAWGALAWMALIGTDGRVDELVFVITAGVIATAPYTLGPVPYAAHVFMLAVAIPMAARAAFTTGAPPLLPILVGGFVVMLAILTRGLGATMIQSLRLRFRTAQLLEESSHTNTLLREKHDALALSEEKFRVLTDLAADGYWEQDARFRFTAMSRSFAGGSDGRESPLALGVRWWDVVGIEPVDSTWEAFRDRLERREPFRDVMLRCACAGTMPRYLMISGAPMLSESEGRILGYRGSMRDVTEAKRAAEELAAKNAALRASESKFRTLTELSSDWYWEQDTHFRFVESIGMREDWAGLGPTAQIGRTHWELPDTEPFEGSWAEHIERLRRHEPFRDMLIRRRAPDGTPHFFHVSGAPNFDGEGRFTGYRGVTKDVTTAVRHEQDLARAKQEAENANRAKSQFLANMSHELRTPLNAVIGTLDLLNGTVLNAEQRRFIALAGTSGRALLAIIDELLEFSKLEAGRFEGEAVELDLHRTVEDVIGMLGAQAAEKDLALAADIDPAVPQRLIGDPGRLRQVLVHLVGNAIKFTEQGGVAVTIGIDERQLAHPEDRSGAHIRLRFAVQDTGIGIDEAILARLFTPFTQADASMSRRFGGTGLGLALSRSIVEALGGRIGVESQLGEGATFWFTLPFRLVGANADGIDSARSEERAVPRVLPASDAPVAAPGSIGPLRVLVIEDNPVNRELVLTMLKRIGLASEHAADGALGVERYRKESFDIVLMDCQMPILDGFGATQRIRELEQSEGRRRTPIVALTANALSGDRERCLSSGMDDYLAKPFKLRELREKLSQWVTLPS